MTLLRGNKTGKSGPQCLPEGSRKPGRPPGPHWTARAARLMMHKFCDGLAQHVCQPDAARYAGYKKAPHQGVRLMNNPLMIHWLALTNYTPSWRAFAWEPLEAAGQSNTAHRKIPANTLVMPRKLLQIRIFDKIYQEPPTNPLVMPTESLVLIGAFAGVSPPGRMERMEHVRNVIDNKFPANKHAAWNTWNGIQAILLKAVS